TLVVSEWRSGDVTRAWVNAPSQLYAYRGDNSLHAVPVHLLELPQDAVRRFQHALKGVSPAVLPAKSGLLLLDPCACVVDHFLTLIQLPFLAYRLRSGSPIAAFG